MTSDPFRSAQRMWRRRRRSNGASGRWIFPAIVAVTVAAALATATDTSPLGLWVFVTVLGGWLITLCLHEFGHALTAYRGGDTSVRDRGYLTLNPAKYTNAAMTFVIPVIILAIGGFPLPGGAVLIEHYRLRSRLWRSSVSLAGPLVNLVSGILLAAVSAGLESSLAYPLAFLGLLQFMVGVLNLLPVPGLDGWGVLTPYLSRATQAKVAPFAPWAPLVLIVILFSLPQVAQPLWDFANWLYELSGGDVRDAAIGSSLFRFWR